MAVEFPQNPVLDETFEAAGILYSWDGTRWVSAYSPSIDYTGPQGATGALGPVGATGPTTDQVTVTETDDPDVAFAIPFVENSATSGITTVYRDFNQLIFNPSTNLLTLKNVTSDLISSGIDISNQFVTTLLDGTGQNPIGISGHVVGGFYSSFATVGAGQGNIIFTTSVSNFSQTKIQFAVHCQSTGNFVNNEYHLYRKVGSEGFDLFNWRGNQYPYPTPIDSLVADSGVVFDDPLIGLYTQRSTTNPTTLAMGVYCKQAGNFDFDIRIKLDRLSIGDAV